MNSLRIAPPQRQSASFKASRTASAPDMSEARSETRSTGNLAKIGLAALAVGGAVMAASGCTAQVPEVADELILHDQAGYDSMPFNLSREEGGDVVVAFDQQDRVFNPGHNDVYDSPRAAFQANYQRGESLCEQAADLGGHCATESLAFIPNGHHGTLQVEQVGPSTINIGPAQMTRNHDGVHVDRPGPDVYLQDNGLIAILPN